MTAMMPATDSIEDLYPLKAVDVSLTCNSNSSPSLPITTGHSDSCEAVIENRAASMANNDCNKALSSPAEASPAKPPSTSPATLERTVDTSPAISHIASAADSLPCEGSNIINMTEDTPSTVSVPPSTPFGNGVEMDFPAKLSFKGVTVTLENKNVWNDFYSCGTEMILTRQGRHMFPFCRYRISGLEPERKYSLVLSVVPSDAYKYRWSSQKWEMTGPAEHLSQGLIRAFAHHYSPCRGADWMNLLVSFKKLRLTNNAQDQEGNIILHSMHRYIPRLHVIPVLDGVTPTPDQPVVMGPESMTFTFPQTEFMAVTTYQNFRITQMKIQYNPFAKGFREDGNNPRLKRINREIELVTMDTAGNSATTEETEDLSAKKYTDAPEKQIILKPIMSSMSSTDGYIPCRGRHALGTLVLVQKRLDVEPTKEQNRSINLTPPMKLCVTVNPKGKFRSSRSAPRLLPKYHKKRKRLNRHWGYPRRKEWKTAASPTEAHSPPLTVAMQPELDDVEGLLFVSFTSKAALQCHVGDRPVKRLLSESSENPQTPIKLKQTVATEIPEGDEEKIAHLEAKLLQDLKVLKHRQAIHPVLQEVGLKLTSLDPTQSVDLHYLGVQLPEQGNALDSLACDNGLPFISRTGKTSDMTKIKGWRNKFIKSTERSSNSDGEKKLSAFCSNMLDEYLESEAQQITERAAAFSANPEGSVAYQLPSKSSSYVKTLDSVLKQRKPPINVSNKPCPLSYKPLQNSASASPASAASPGPAEVQPVQQPKALHIPPSTASGLCQNNSIIHRLSLYLPELKNKQAVTPEGNRGMSWKTAGLSKPQVKLFEMELGAWNQGLNTTQLAADRLTVALSAVVTKSTQLNEVLKVPQYPKVSGPACGLEFCRLGCICQSLLNLHKGPFHCRRSECMLGCSCFKRKITKHLAMTEEHTSPSHSIKPMGLGIQPNSKFHPQKLWIKNICDSDQEPLLIPKQTVNLVPPKASFTAPPTIREEDKDPVYKFLESRLTCARVREFNSKPPPVETLEDITAPMNLTKSGEKMTEKLLTKPHQNVYVLKKAGQAGSGPVPHEKQSRTRIEIQSTCQWSGDRKMVLEALCLNMNRNKLCQPISVGPYRIRPVAKIVMQKPTGSVITFRVCISLRSNSKDHESDDSDEEKQHNSFEEDMIIENCQEMKEPQFSVGVTPFLCRVLPAGVLTAKTAATGCQASGLIQVNGKSYNHARLMVGRMGSLHPANRLAAHLSGRLDVCSNRSNKVPDSSKSALKIIPPFTPLIKATTTTDVKMEVQPTAKALLPDSWKTRIINSLTQPPKPNSSIKPMQTFVPSKRSSAGPFQSSSPVSLTVSPSLKTPSFLGQSGTYSFRICPPDNEDTTLPGVPLPGGFTLIQLPTPGASGTLTQQSNTTNWKGFLSQLICDENKTNSGQRVTYGDMASDDISSDFSDDCEDDDDDMSVDVETVEEMDQRTIITKLKIAAGMGARQFRGSRSEFSSVKSRGTQGYIRDKHHMKYEKKYTERQRRSEQRVRFDHLQAVLDTDPKAPRLHLLSMAVKEIENLTEQSKYLEVKKRMLTQINEGYVKQVALLSGKSELAVLEKLQDVSKKQEQREQIKWNPSFSGLLQSRAAMVQPNSSSSKPESIPLGKPDLDAARVLVDQPTSQDTPDTQTNPAEQIKATAKNFLQQLLSKLKPIIHKAKSNHQALATEKHSSTQDASPLQSLKLLSQTINYPLPAEEVAPTVSGSLVASQKDNAKIEALSTSSSFIPVPQPQPMALPLIRSKTGRIILPSSMKPIGQGFYTFTVVKSNKDGEEGEGNSTIYLQPFDADSLKKQEINVSESVNPDSNRKHVLVDVKSIQSPNSQTKPEVVQSPQANTAHLNNSISSPPTALPSADISQTGLSQPLTTACLTLKPVVKPEPTHVPVTRRGRGRPRKYSPPLTTPKPKLNVAVKEGPNYVQTYGSTESNKRQAVTTDALFIPIKRGRGRPPKNKQPNLPSPKVWKAQTSPKSYRNSVDRPYETETNTFVENTTASRPLTRGSLGKDFPSAKKRSWIDLERELEQDVE